MIFRSAKSRRIAFNALGCRERQYDDAAGALAHEPWEVSSARQESKDQHEIAISAVMLVAVVVTMALGFFLIGCSSITRLAIDPYGQGVCTVETKLEGGC